MFKKTHLTAIAACVISAVATPTAGATGSPEYKPRPNQIGNLDHFMSVCDVKTPTVDPICETYLSMALQAAMQQYALVSLAAKMGAAVPQKKLDAVAALDASKWCYGAVIHMKTARDVVVARIKAAGVRNDRAAMVAIIEALAKGPICKGTTK